VWFAAAAAALVLATAGATWRIARARDSQPVRVAAAPTAAPAATAPTVVPSSPAAESAAPPLAVSAPRAATPERSARSTAVPVARVVTFEEDAELSREIASLREVVQTRYAELDSGTVAVIKRNLAIIDAAIADSRKALRKDPRNRFLADELDRALTQKIALMRQAALLERGS
jgi:plasmid maintenance system killer protein